MISGQYLARRLCFSAVSFLVCITITFLLLHLMPGDYITNYLLSLGRSLPKEAVDQFYHQFGLDLPLTDQYFLYIINIAHGNWGYSYASGQPVFTLITQKLFWSLVLILPSTIMGIFIGTVIGAWSGWRSGSRIDLLLYNIMIVIRAIPEFWWAIMAVIVFSFYLRWFPLGGYAGIGVLSTGVMVADVIYHAALPVALMTFFSATGNYYVMRNSMIAVIGEDYITTALAKGVDERGILWRHALKNALLPMVTIASFQFAAIVAGNVFVETIFSWPGIGLLTSEALTLRDLPLLEGILLIDTLFIILASIAADVLASSVDPRIRMGDDD